MPRILIAEDDPNMGTLLGENLRMAGYAVDLVADGIEAKRVYSLGGIDLAILDVMMPGMDGLQLAVEIRAFDPKAVIMFVSARNTQIDKLQGFLSGCDDYITKPFNIEELLFRVKAILERTMGPRALRVPVISFGGATLDVRAGRLVLARRTFELTATETRIMHVFACNLGQMVARSEVLEKVWGRDDPYHSKSLDVHLTRIRKYLKHDGRLNLRNVHGKGYELCIADPAATDDRPSTASNDRPKQI